MSRLTPNRPANLVTLLHDRAVESAANRAFTFLGEGKTETDVATFGSLWSDAQTIAARLSEDSQPGDRALLLYQPGLPFVSAFFGCLLARVVAVPTYPPRRNRRDERVRAIVQDADARFILTTSDCISGLEKSSSYTPALRDIEWVATDTLQSAAFTAFEESAIEPDTLAFLQYTSGSTSTPKGVMVGHGNLLATLEDLHLGYQHSQDSVLVSWLPTFHDMGLIYGVLMSVYLGLPSILMPPAAFLQRPMNWLEAISRYRGTHSAAPNFAYEMCAERISAEDRETLDLSSWVVALNAAEPVREETIERFTTAFSGCGFRSRTMKSGYGLAEAALKVTGDRASDDHVCLSVDGDALANNRVVEADESTANVQRLVGCGVNEIGMRVLIVDPDSCQACAEDHIGEIWVSGASVAQGYWNRPQETQDTFCARLSDSGEEPFLRTGDLGFKRGDQLWITGRLKDVIIIRGLNHYPQDIEFTVGRSHSSLRMDSGAAFSVEVAGEERLVVAQEVERAAKRDLNVEEVVAAVRRAVAEEHDLQLHAVVLLRPTSVPKTSSGKIQRQACRQAFLDGELRIVGEWRAADSEESVVGSDDRVLPAQVDLQAWLIPRLSRWLAISTESIDPAEPLTQYGMDSATAVRISGELGRALARQFAPTLLYDYPTVRQLAEFLRDADRAEFAFGPKQADDGDDAVAIIGMGCRFPGASSVDEFWRLLSNGNDAVTEVPAARWDVDQFYDSDATVRGRMNTRFGGFLEAVDQFDPAFFRISPREARCMDPQQRLLLEVAWEALENAGRPDLKTDLAGVFIGISGNDYLRLQQNTDLESDSYSATGNALSIAANRLSYVLDLHGPSWSVDTACSSSLVAVHQAIRSLRAGDCGVALCGGVNLILAPDWSLRLSHAGMMSPDGRCQTFDAGANGYVRGEGCGIVVLKRLSDALRDGDSICAVLRGSAVNQDGQSNGLTAPNGPSQQLLVHEALRDAGLSADCISFVETHGTGTALGDPIEVNALRAVLDGAEKSAPTCWLGAVKTNIGHLEAAAGIAGLIKTVLALKNERIPANLNFRTINSAITLDESRLALPVESQSWTSGDQRRFAGVSSFGFGGTNAHVILEEAPPVAVCRNEVERPGHILTLSAKSPAAVRALANACALEAAQHSGDSPADFCFSANTGREHFRHRVALVAETFDELRDRLVSVGNGDRPPHCSRPAGVDSGRFPLAFLFTGQGSQYAGMGRELFDTQPTFRRHFDHCAEILKSELDVGLPELLFGAGSSDQAELLQQTAYAQPALFALEYSLYELWKSWGVEPTAVMGHSVGEYVAACAAGVFTLEDGLKLIAVRSRLMQSLPAEGAMLAISGDPQQILEMLPDYGGVVSAAAINGPQQIVVSGDRVPIGELADRLKSSGIHSQALRVSHAFHSHRMEPILGKFQEAAAQVQFSAPRLHLISNLTGRPADESIATPEYWTNHIRQPVQFAAGIRSLRQLGIPATLECGPAPILSALAATTDSDEAALRLHSLSPRRSDCRQMLETLAECYVHGWPVDWAGVDQDFSRQRLSLPTYPFERESYWVEPSSSELSLPTIGTSPDADSPPGRRIDSAVPRDEVEFEYVIRTDRQSWLLDHVVCGSAVVPASLYVELAIAAADAVGLPSGEAEQPSVVANGLSLDSFEILRPLKLDDASRVVIHVVLCPDAEGAWSLQILQRAAGTGNDRPEWRPLATGLLASVPGSPDPPPDPAAIEERLDRELHANEFYRQVNRRGLELGPAFRAVKKIRWAGCEALGWIESTDVANASHVSDGRSPTSLHPVLLDACVQVLGAVLPDDSDSDAWLQVGFERFVFHNMSPADLLSHVRVQKTDSPHTLSADLSIFSADGTPVAEIEGLTLQRANPVEFQSPTRERPSRPFFHTTWVPERRPGARLPRIPLAETISRARQKVDVVASQEDVIRFSHALRHIEELCGDLVCHAFDQLNVPLTHGAEFTLEEAAQGGGVVVEQLPLFARLLAILEEDGVLQRSRDTWKVVGPKQSGDALDRLQRLPAEFPIAAAELELLGRCGPMLADVLRGTCDATQVLFPGGDLSALRRMYHEGIPSAAMNALLLESMTAVLDALPADQPIRILEIGAGTGSTTSHLLPALPADRATYVFTDVSELFTSQAAQEFTNVDFLEYRLLDIERDPRDQGFEAGEFDLIIASNVLHATRDLERSVKHARQLLRPNGLMLLLEGTRPLRLLDLIFGITDGWWRFEDRALRPAYPLVSTDTWRDVLTSNGFDRVATVPHNDDYRSALPPQTVILAGADGGRESAARHSGETDSNDQRATDRWLIVAHDADSGRRFAAAMSDTDTDCVLVANSDGYGRVSASEYRIDFAEPEDFRRVVHDVAADGCSIFGVLFFTDPDAKLAESADTPQVVSALETSCRSALFLTQALIRNNVSLPGGLRLVTRGAMLTGHESAEGHYAVDPVQAALWGFGKVVAREHGELGCRLIDLDPCCHDHSLRELVAELQTDVESVPERIAVRGAQRLTVQLEQLPDHRADSRVDLSSGTVLITGGFGAIGASVARWAVENGATHLVLAGRTVDSDSALALRTEFADRGVEVLASATDVSQVEQVRAMLDSAAASMPPLIGVVHAAGIFDDRLINDHSWEYFETVFAAKACGAWNLHRLTQDLSLQFFALFSSASTAIGMTGLANYVAANEFLDALAVHRHALGLPAISLDWVPWAGLGMADAVADVREQQWEAMGITSLPVERALELLGEAIQRPDAHIAVMPVDWSRLRSYVRDASVDRFLRPVLQQSENTDVRYGEIRRQIEAAPEGDRRRLLSEHVRLTVAEVLGWQRADQIDAQQGFFDMGMDSLRAVELRNLLQVSLGTTLPATMMFRFPSPDALIGFLARDVLHLESAAHVAEPSLIEPEPVEAASDDADLQSMIDQELADLEHLLKEN